MSTFLNKDFADISCSSQIVDKLMQAEPEIVAFDGNLSPESMAALVLHCEKSGTPSEPSSFQ